MIQDFQHIFATLSTTQWALLLAFVVIFILRLLYLFLFSARMVFQKRKAPRSSQNEKLSIIITVRNEEGNIRKNLQTVLQLDNDNFEVVAIDDYSQDNTLSILGLLKQRFHQLKISSLSQETRFSTKLAQNIALLSAENNWVLTVPISINDVNKAWLQSFLNTIGTAKTSIVIGYSTVKAQKGFFNLLYRIENFFQHIQSVGFILNGIAFVQNEENVAFKKEKYFEMGGYAKNMKEPYANLELIINNFIKKKNTVVNSNAQSVLRKDVSINKASYLDLLRKSQRIKNNLGFVKRLSLWFNNITQLLFIPLLVLCFAFCFKIWSLISILIAAKVLAHMLIIKISLNSLNERKIFIPSLAYALLMPYFKIIFAWHFNKTSKKQQWRKML